MLFVYKKLLYRGIIIATVMNVLGDSSCLFYVNSSKVVIILPLWYYFFNDYFSGAKKLPCGHIFHASCLRSWFQRQQTCPTCRMDILRQTQPTPNIPTPQPQQPAQAPPQTPAAAQPPQQQAPQQIRMC